jgi:esterase
MPVLAHQRVTHEGAAPTRWIYFLHGIFGMGTNFRGVAKSLAAAAPDWDFVLVDLRGHGASQGFAPPHTLAAAAADVEALSREIGLEIAGVAGHSFGGKVLL